MVRGQGVDWTAFDCCSGCNVAGAFCLRHTILNDQNLRLAHSTFEKQKHRRFIPAVLRGWAAGIRTPTT